MLFHLTGLEELDAPCMPEFPTMNQQGGSFCFESLVAPSYVHQLAPNHYINTPSQKSLSSKPHELDHDWIRGMVSGGNLSNGGGSRDKSAGSGRSEDDSDNWIAMLM
jgi:hypothetical protein